MRTLRSALSLLAVSSFPLPSTAQQVVAPDNCVLGAVNSTTTAWRTTDGHFQLAYDSTHFTNAGVAGPVLLTRLRFRARDGEPTPGGQAFTGVSVRLGDSAVNYASMSSTFATNFGTMGPLGTANVVAGAAAGGVPNDAVIDIDLVACGAATMYDPSSGNDLLIDITFTAPTPATNLVPFSAGSATAATARARMCSAATTTATTGVLGAPPVVMIDFAGAGGYAAPAAARIERFGYGCAAPLRSFYQDWQISETFDLANTSLLMLPNSVSAPTSYTVIAGGTPPDLTKVNPTANSVADNAVVTHALGFTFNHSSGSTTSINACTDGYVWLDTAMTLADSTPAVAELLGISVAQTARIAPFWYNFHCGRNTASFANAGLHVMTDTSGGPGNAVAYVTWFKVGRSDVTPAGASVSDLQCVLHEASGIIEVRFGSMQVGAQALGITGFSPGRVGTVASFHPGPRDLSHETPFTIEADGGAHALTLGTNTMARPIVGTSITLQSYNQPAGTVLGLMCLDVQSLSPSVPIPGLLAPGCGLSLMPGSFFIHEIVVNPTGTYSAAPIAIPAAWHGQSFYAQYAACDALLANISMSNGLKLTAGLN
ncbi:MAG TPA: hypothetical protein VF384_12950 [Planctomycetota bacterium]